MNVWDIPVFWVLSTLFLVYLAQKYLRQKEVTLYYAPTKKNQAILKNLSSMINSFRPSVFIPTVLELYFSVQKVKCLKHFERQEITLSDGEVVSLDWYPKNARNMEAGSPVIVVVPGLTSDSRSGYANIFAKYAVSDYGFRVAIVNRRGYCGMPYKREDPDPITWNKFSDLDEIINTVKTEFPFTNLYLTGFSMGANFIQKFAGLKGKAKEHLPVKAIGCISSPYCLKTTTKRLNSGVFFKRAMAHGLKETFQNHLHDEKFQVALKKRKIDPSKVLASRCSDEFNKNFSIHFTSHKCLNGYKEEVSSVGFVQHIEVPTLAVNAKTDPISPFDAIPFSEIEKNPNYIQVVTNGGGHLEYFSGLNLRRWSYDLVLAYFKNLEIEALE